MKEIIVSLVVGIVIGIVFKLLKLPVPVPHAIGGIVGILGMFLGSEAAIHITKLMSSKWKLIIYVF